jgi:hypothetical protein
VDSPEQALIKAPTANLRESCAPEQRPHVWPGCIAGCHRAVPLLVLAALSAWSRCRVQLLRRADEVKGRGDRTWAAPLSLPYRHVIRSSAFKLPSELAVNAQDQRVCLQVEVGSIFGLGRLLKYINLP